MSVYDFKVVDGVLVEYTGFADSVALPSGIREIGPRVFSMNYKLKRIAFNVGLERIGEEAFSRSGVENVTLPFTVNYIGRRAFANSAIRRISIPNQTVTIAEKAFVSCSKLEVAYMPEHCASDFIFAPNWEFPDNISPWFQNHPKGIRSFQEYQQEVQAREKQREETYQHWLKLEKRMARGRCRWCGGPFTFPEWFTGHPRYCTKCGEPKDY